MRLAIMVSLPFMIDDLVVSRLLVHFEVLSSFNIDALKTYLESMLL